MQESEGYATTILAAVGLSQAVSDQIDMAFVLGDFMSEESD